MDIAGCNISKRLFLEAGAKSIAKRSVSFPTSTVEVTRAFNKPKTDLAKSWRWLKPIVVALPWRQQLRVHQWSAALPAHSRPASCNSELWLHYPQQRQHFVNVPAVLILRYKKRTSYSWSQYFTCLSIKVRSKFQVLLLLLFPYRIAFMLFPYALQFLHTYRQHTAHPPPQNVSLICHWISSRPVINLEYL